MSKYEKARDEKFPVIHGDKIQSYDAERRRVAWCNQDRRDGADWSRDYHQEEIKDLILENCKLRAREINGSLRGYDGTVDKYEARIKELEAQIVIAREALNKVSNNKFIAYSNEYCSELTQSEVLQQRNFLFRFSFRINRESNAA